MSRAPKRPTAAPLCSLREMGEWHLFLGQALVRQGRMDEARAALLHAEQLDPAALQWKRDELAAAGYSPEAVDAYWRALTGGAAPL